MNRPRRRRVLMTALVAVVAFALCALAAGCSSDPPTANPTASASSASSAGSSSPSSRAGSIVGPGGPSDTTNGAPPVSDVPREGAPSLESLLITDVPAGFTRLADETGQAGPSNLDKAVKDDGAPDAREVLTKAGFVEGYQRAWTDPSGAVIIDFLYRFESEAGAAAYMKHATDQIRSGKETEPLHIGVPWSEGIRVVDARGPSAVVDFTVGPYLAQVVVANGDDPAALLETLAVHQYDLLLTA